MSTRSDKLRESGTTAAAEGLRLHALARSALQYCEHELALLDDEGLPIFVRDEVVPKLSQALHHANDLQAALVELVRLADPEGGDWKLGGDTDGELRDAAEVLRVHGKLDEAVAFYSAIVGVVVDGNLTDPQALQIARAIKRACGARQQPDAKTYHAMAERVVAWLSPSVATIAADDRFGKADVAGRVRRLIEHPTTIAELARELASTERESAEAGA